MPGHSPLLHAIRKDAEAIELATRTFQRLKDEAKWGIEKVASRSDLDQAQASKGAFLAVSMASGFTAGSAAEGAWVTPSRMTRGTHGYWPGPEELDAAFCAFGEGIPKTALPRGRLIDVAPTVAKLLNLPLDGEQWKKPAAIAGNT